MDIFILVNQLRSRFERLDVLFNNAEANLRKKQETMDGIEMRFALNHKDFFLLADPQVNSM